MKIVFVSNYYNHHQAPFSEAISSLPEVQYYFIETGVMSDERKKLGYGMERVPSYVIQNEAYISKKAEFQSLIDNADVVIFGSAPDDLLKNRHKRNVLTFRYSERLYRKDLSSWKMILKYIKTHFRYGQHRNEYLLCSSAFAAADFAKSGNYIGRAFKWGYFPEVKRYESLEVLMGKKKSASILWVGRLIEWKHPDASILLAEKLRKSGYGIQLNIIGSGILEQQLKDLISAKGLTDCVHMLGSMSPDKVREHMEQAEIFLFTSDRNEGWGAVLNEAMNSGCAIVASHEIGSVPFLLKNKENGIIYQDGDENSLFQNVKWLLENSDSRRHLGEAAYRTIISEWNAKVASDRFVQLIHELLIQGNAGLFTEGPCSRAEMLEDGWFRS